jgi:hypothetical protein
VQAEQDRQADPAGHERHRHHDTDDHEVVAAPDAVASPGGAVVLVLRAMDVSAVAVEEGVVHRYGDRGTLGYEAFRDRAGQAHLVQVPHRAGEEPVCARPVCLPGQARGLPHPGDRARAARRQRPGDQRRHRRERGRGEARPQDLQNDQQGRRYGHRHQGPPRSVLCFAWCPVVWDRAGKVAQASVAAEQRIKDEERRRGSPGVVARVRGNLNRV